MFLRITVAMLAAITCAAGSAAFGGPERRAAATAEEAPRTGDIVVRFDADATLADVGDALLDAQAQAKASSAGSRLVLVSPEQGQSVDDALAELGVSESVEFAEADHVIRIADTIPNDPYYTGYQWNLPQIGLPQAWDTTTGGPAGSSPIIAVIDTGVSTTHPELSGKLVAGRNVIAGNSNANDDQGHGTSVAGIIAANTHNSSQMAGVCWTCRIMPIKALDSSGSGSTFNVSLAIDWAVDHGARIVNLSLGSCTGDSSLQTAVNRATAPPFNAVVIAASGNYDPVGSPPGECSPEQKVMFPAAYANVIAVGASTQAGARASFSSYGPELDIVAPGDGVVVTVMGNPPGGPFGGWGTSFAAPHVAGVAGLLMAAGITDRAEITNRLISTATDLAPAGPDQFTGSGRVHAAAALSAPDTTPPTVAITAPANGASVSGSIPFTATASDAGGIEKVRFWVDGVSKGWIGGNKPSYNITLNTTTLSNGPHALKAQAIDQSGNEAWATINVTVSNGDTTAPMVAITAPTNGATIGGSVPFTVTASDLNGMNRVRFWVDGVSKGWIGGNKPSYNITLNTTALSNGPHALKAQAIDLAGNEAWATINVTVSNPDTTPPAVSIITPTDGATVSGSISFTVTALDLNGIDKVRFWVDGVSRGWIGGTKPSYTIGLDTTALSDGSHELRAQAIDKSGNESWHTINVTVSN